MTSSPGPPPGTPDPGNPAQPEPERKGTNKPLAALVLIIGVIAAVVIVGFIFLVASASSSSNASDDYCTVANDLNTAIGLGQEGADLPLLQAIADKGEAQAPPEIVGAWTQLDGALADLNAPQAGALADEATDAIYNHWVKVCN